MQLDSYTHTAAPFCCRVLADTKRTFVLSKYNVWFLKINVTFCTEMFFVDVLNIAVVHLCWKTIVHWKTLVHCWAVAIKVGILYMLSKRNLIVVLLIIWKQRRRRFNNWHWVNGSFHFLNKTQVFCNTWFFFAHIAKNHCCAFLHSYTILYIRSIEGDRVHIAKMYTINWINLYRGNGSIDLRAYIGCVHF